MKRRYKRLTNERTINKYIETMSVMLEIYSISIFLNMVMIVLKINELLINEDIFVLLTGIIWVTCCVAYSIILANAIIREYKATKKGKSKMNGGRSLIKDVRANKKRSVKSFFMCLMFILLKLNAIVVTISITVFFFNIITFKNAVKYRDYFNEERGGEDNPRSFYVKKSRKVLYFVKWINKIVVNRK